MVNTTVIVYDAVSGEFKGEFYYNVNGIERDLTCSTNSTINIFNINNVLISELDVLYFPNLNGIEITAIVNKVNIANEYFKQEIDFYFGADTYSNDVLMISNSIETNGLSEDNGEQLNVKITSSQMATATDNLLGFDSIARQIMRKSIHEEIFSINEVHIFERLNQDYEYIRLDDPQIKVTKLNIANDKFNTLTLYNEDDLTQNQTYYLTEDGEVTIDPTNRVLPQKAKSEKSLFDSWNSLSYAKSVIKEQEYNNQLVFSLPINNNIQCLNLSNKALLGQRLKVRLLNGEWLETIVSGYRMENNLELKITCGLTRTKLTKILKIRGQ